MSYKPKVITVPEGGTGVPTLTGVLTGNGTGSITANTVTQNNVLTAGASNAVSSISPGTSGNVLTSNGTDWASSTASSSGFGSYLYIQNWDATSSPADGVTYVMGCKAFNTNQALTNAVTRMYVASAGTITSTYGAITVAGTLGSTQSCTLSIRLNNATDTTISSTLQLSAATNLFSATGLSIAVVAGDYVEFKFVSPTWSPNPTLVSFSGSILIT